MNLSVHITTVKRNALKIALGLERSLCLGEVRTSWVRVPIIRFLDKVEGFLLPSEYASDWIVNKNTIFDCGLQNCYLIWEILLKHVVLKCKNWICESTNFIKTTTECTFWAVVSRCENWGWESIIFLKIKNYAHLTLYYKLHKLQVLQS